MRSAKISAKRRKLKKNFSEINMGLFGATKVDPKKQVNEMQSVLRRETRAIDRQIRDIERQQEKTKNMLKQNAKKGDKAACRILAKEIVNSKKAVSRMYQSKAQLNSVMVKSYLKWLNFITDFR